MKWLATFALLLISLPILAQQNKAAPQAPTVKPQQAQPVPGPGPGPGPGQRPPGPPPAEFEAMKKQAVSRLDKRITIMETAKSCIEEAKDGPSFGECMKTMGESHKAEDQKLRAEEEKRREEAQKRGLLQPQNNQPTKFKIEEAPKVAPKVKIEESKPEVKKK